MDLGEKRLHLGALRSSEFLSLGNLRGGQLLRLGALGDGQLLKFGTLLALPGTQFGPPIALLGMQFSTPGESFGASLALFRALLDPHLVNHVDNALAGVPAHALQGGMRPFSRQTGFSE